MYDVEFSGAAATRSGPGTCARGDTPAAPVVVKFIGYGGGRGVPAEHILLPALGYALLVMDSRGQGGRWTTGATPDGRRHRPGELPGHDQGHHRARGLLLHPDVHRRRARGGHRARTAPGAGRPRRGHAGAARAARWRSPPPRCAGTRSACATPTFRSCATSSGRSRSRRTPPYTEIPEFLAENVALIDAALNTLRYVDCALLARRITAATLISVGLMDDICPPSTVFAAYNEITADKDIVVYPYSGHSVPHAHAEPQLRHLRQHLPVAAGTGRFAERGH